MNKIIIVVAMLLCINSITYTINDRHNKTAEERRNRMLYQLLLKSLANNDQSKISYLKAEINKQKSDTNNPTKPFAKL